MSMWAKIVCGVIVIGTAASIITARKVSKANPETWAEFTAFTNPGLFAEAEAEVAAMSAKQKADYVK